MWPVRAWIIRRAIRCNYGPQLRELRELAILMIVLIQPAGPIGRLVYDAMMRSDDKRNRESAPAAIMLRKISIDALKESER